MNIAQAYDDCIEAAEKYARARDNAARLRNRRMTAHFERKMRTMLARAEECLKHPAMACRISPVIESDITVKFRVVAKASGRYVVSAPSLREAEAKAAEYGFRVLDTVSCGVYHF